EIAAFLAFSAFVTSICSQQPQRLEHGTSLEKSLGPGEVHTYVVRLEPGESAEIVVRQMGVDVVVEVRDPGGRLMDSIDSPTGRNGDEVADVIAGEGGEYSIGVKPISPREPVGKYRVELRLLRTPAE